ncbi:hypothetical protein [Rummeliibacillus pycnus]
MEENKYASLNEEKVKELKELEEKFGYALVAYDTDATKGSQSNNSDSSFL